MNFTWNINGYQWQKIINLNRSQMEGFQQF